jgi:TrpR-related protein YerC/YecD
MAVNPKLKDEEADHLFRGILQLRNIDECYMFFEDVCTITEIKAIAQRFTVARMLKKGKTYSEIVEATGASSATISRVNHFIKYGADGYNIVLDRLEDLPGGDREYKPE